MKISIVLPALLALTTVVHAESLEEKKYWKTQQDYVDRSLKSAEKVCEMKFSFEWLDKGTLRTETEKNHNSPNGVCSHIVDRVAMLCRAGADEKAAVKAKIKGFSCGYAEPRNLSLSGGIV